MSRRNKILFISIVSLLLYIVTAYLVAFLVYVSYFGIHASQEFKRFLMDPLSLVSILFEDRDALRETVHETFFDFRIQVPFLLLVAIYLLFSYLEQLFRSKPQKKEASDYGSHGTARWATEKEMKVHYMQDDKGFILGTTQIKGKKKRVIHPINGNLNQNIMTFGPSGSGKTSGYVIPNVLYTAQNLGHSMVITDPKGELFNLTSETLKQYGYDIWVFNLLTGQNNPRMLKSLRYNPLDYVTTTEEAMQLANTIINNTGGESAADPFWSDAEKSYLSALILYIKEKRPKQEQHIRSLLTFGVNAGQDEKFINGIFDELDPTSEAKAMFELFKTCKSENTRSGVLMGFGIRLQQWISNGIAQLTQTSDFDINDLGKSKIILYIMIPDYDRTYNLLPSLLIGQCFQELYKQAGAKDSLKLDIPVKFILDEMGNVAPVYDLDQKITTMRSRGISLVSIFQDLDQVQKNYHKWRTVISSCDTIFFLGTNESETAKYFSGKLGETTIMIDSFSESAHQNGSSEGKNQNFINRNLMTPDELERLDRSKLVVFQAGRYPLLLDKLFYYKESDWENLPQVNWVTDFPARKNEPLIIFDPKSEEKTEITQPPSNQGFIDNIIGP